MHTTWQALWRGLRLLCPDCGHGRIYARFTVMSQRCPVCGAQFEGEGGEFVGGVMIAYAITAVLVIAGVLAVEWWTDLPAAFHLVLWSVFSAVFLLTCYRNMKGLWLGIVAAMMGLNHTPPDEK